MKRAVVGHRLVDDVPLDDVARVAAHDRPDVVLHDRHQLVAPPAGQRRRRLADELAERVGQRRQGDRWQAQADLVQRTVVDEPERQRLPPDERVPAHRLAVALGEADELVAGGEVVLAAARLQRLHLHLVLGRERVELTQEGVAIAPPVAQRGEPHGAPERDVAQRDRRRGRSRRLRGPGRRQRERRERGEHADSPEPSVSPHRTSECTACG
jgi:hypothetical protein